MNHGTPLLQNPTGLCQSESAIATSPSMSLGAARTNSPGRLLTLEWIDGDDFQ
jgi:hypothetical protein